MKLSVLAASASLMAASSAFAADGSVTLSIDPATRLHPIPSTLYGMFFEDINFAGDGGLYPELIANRGFDWKTKTLEGWENDFRGDGMARVTVRYGRPLHPMTAQCLRIEAFGAGAGTGVRNRGYHGICVKAGESYDLSLYLRGLDAYAGNVRVVLENKEGKVVCEHVIANKDMSLGAKRGAGDFPLPAWKRHTAVFTPAETVRDGSVSILLDRAGAIELEQVSLFPQKTFNGRKNGLRKDLVQLLKDMKPGVFRFPGGCITEGNDWTEWYDWKLSVGDGTPYSRDTLWNRWGYWQSLSLGYFEYFCLCEDIGAEPLPVMNAGLTCQFAHPWDLAPVSSVPYFVKSFNDLIEFANGDAKTTTWGAVRAKMGHPKPFGLKYVGVGNENWGKEFFERYEPLVAELRKIHPEIKIVGSSGPSCGGPDFDFAWNRLTPQLADIVDEHYYLSADWFLGNTYRYDGYDRTGKKPHVYAGEYACHLPDRANTLYGALTEAAMMTGFERNSDVVEMSSYAPLFAKVGHQQWAPNLIWFDNEKSFGTPSYYVQKLFGNNLPTDLVKSSAVVEGQKLGRNGSVYLHTWKTSAEFKDFKMVAKDGTVLMDRLPDPAKCRNDGDCDWRLEGDTLKQNNIWSSGTRLFFGEKDWSSYTVTFKARRTGGNEGFIFGFHQGSVDANVNIGGWDNSKHAIASDRAKITGRVENWSKIEDKRWYDVKIVVDGSKVSASLDGQVVLDGEITDESLHPDFFQVCGVDAKTGELIAKCVNVTPKARPLTVSFATKLPMGTVKVETLTGDRDVKNDLDNPTRCAPVAKTVAFGGGSEFKSEVPAYSLTVFRFQTR